MSPVRRILTSLAVLTRSEFWALLFAFLAFAELPAELYLASFGPPGMTHFDEWSVTGFAYSVRHFPTLFVAFPLALLAMVLFPGWIALCVAPGLASVRRAATRVLAICVMGFAVLVVAEWAAHDVRQAVLQRAADRMTPLVAAIQRFETETGRPPYDLAELPPRYAPMAQHFGVRGCRSLQYSVAPADVDWRWQLGLECPNGMLRLDRFFFRPTRNYADWGNPELFGEWAYNWD